MHSSWPILTRWGRVTHIFFSKLSVIGSDNGLSPGRRQAIIWINAGIFLIEALGTNFSEILSEIHTFSFTIMHFKMSSVKWRPCCRSLSVLKHVSLGSSNRWNRTSNKLTLTLLTLSYHLSQLWPNQKTSHDQPYTWLLWAIWIIHLHGFPDITAEQLINILQQTFQYYFIQKNKLFLTGITLLWFWLSLCQPNHSSKHSAS